MSAVLPSLKHKAVKDELERGLRVERSSFYRVLGFGFLILFSLLILAFPSDAYVIRGNIEGIYLVRPSNQFIDTSYYPPEYLELEDLVFYTCLEEDNLSIRSSVLCRDDNSFDDLTVYKWSDRNCF
ncbi:hypothetical protein D6764_00445, partial [Candidatus Woesearchaeota archaeon]